MSILFLCFPFLYLLLVYGLLRTLRRFLKRSEFITVGSSPSSDYQTISEAMQDAVPGQTVLVKPGTYRESIVLREGVRVRGYWEDYST